MRVLPDGLLRPLAARRRSDALYIIWFCWGAALLLYVLGSAYYTLPIVPLLLVALFLMVEKIGMFGRKRNETRRDQADVAATVIAQGARFKGELQLEGNLEIYGQFTGALKVNGGTVHIMIGGRVEGELTAPQVIVNGILEGTCVATEVEILENGKVKGILQGGSLSIRKGGQFIGQSQSSDEIRPAGGRAGESKNNVKKLQPEYKTKVAEVAAASAKLG